MSADVMIKASVGECEFFNWVFNHSHQGEAKLIHI